MQIQARPLREFITAIFTAAGTGDAEAACLAEHLAGANLAGHDSHGVIRVPIYVRWLQEGKIRANRTLQVVFENETMALVDGQLGFGQWVGQQAVRLGIEKCRRYGVAVIALRGSGHLGRIGHWSEMSASAGLVALHFVNTTGLGMHVVPAGGLDRRLSVNPISIGVPMPDRSPVVLDIAAAATAEGKLKVARNKGLPVPDGWIVDAEGRPSNDANDFYGPPSGSILPLGGHKGYGLGVMAELLAGALTGGGCSREGIKHLEQGMLSIFIDPRRLREDADAFFGEVRRYVDFVKTSRPTTPDGQVLVPGDIEQQNRKQRLGEGIELDDTTWHQLVETAQSCGVSQESIPC